VKKRDEEICRFSFPYECAMCGIILSKIAWLTFAGRGGGRFEGHLTEMHDVRN
jgi:hypothetical protein